MPENSTLKNLKSGFSARAHKRILSALGAVRPWLDRNLAEFAAAGADLPSREHGDTVYANAGAVHVHSVRCGRRYVRFKKRQTRPLRIGDCNVSLRCVSTCAWCMVRGARCVVRGASASDDCGLRAITGGLHRRSGTNAGGSRRARAGACGRMRASADQRRTRAARRRTMRHDGRARHVPAPLRPAAAGGAFLRRRASLRRQILLR
ncbi:LAFE_0H13190g1_1 [Lachancea fermentati]|uniref:LAFE_0H13190g1_1 n=1 Tax=Lachancea fermentati TaxID=4955 RepID=A0A1G4MKK6_LACFM|nr:LAFE_0H13190g1_1 [Lachancea fermentati]